MERRFDGGIYSYLTVAFDLVAWWAAENRALDRARKALRLQNINPSDHEEPFAAIIRFTADPGKVDKPAQPVQMVRIALRANRLPNRWVNS